jgi:hypothetical protein
MDPPCLQIDQRCPDIGLPLLSQNWLQIKVLSARLGFEGCPLPFIPATKQDALRDHTSAHGWRSLIDHPDVSFGKTHGREFHFNVEFQIQSIQGGQRLLGHQGDVYIA